LHSRWLSVPNAEYDFRGASPRTRYLNVEPKVRKCHNNQHHVQNVLRQLQHMAIHMRL